MGSEWHNNAAPRPHDAMTHIITKSGIVRPVHATKNKRKKQKKETSMWQTGYSPRPPTSSDRNQSLYWIGGYSLQVDVPSFGRRWNRFKVMVYEFRGGRNLPFPIALASGLPYQQWLNPPVKKRMFSNLWDKLPVNSMCIGQVRCILPRR